MTNMPLVAGWTDSATIKIPGLPKKEGRGSSTAYTQVAPGFFETMQIPILAGRPIGQRDHEGAPTAAVVNEVFAKKYFPGVSPIGRHFSFTGKNAIDIEIVGLAKTARYGSLTSEVPPVSYLSYLQAQG
jgi:hypothetical protein